MYIYLYRVGGGVFDDGYVTYLRASFDAYLSIYIYMYVYKSLHSRYISIFCQAYIHGDTPFDVN